MNRRVLLISIGAVIFLIIVGVLAWGMFSPEELQNVEPTPTPIQSVGILPSTDPFVTPSTSVAPITFGGVCPDTWASQQDTDRDSLPDSVESSYGTDPSKSDSDNDAYSDGEEVLAGYNPLSATGSARLDSDNDGLLDNEECVLGTDPFNPDSDNDGFQDGAELKNGFDPTKKGDGKGSDRIATPTPAPTVVPVDLSQPTPTPNVGAFATPTPVSSTTQLSLIPLSQLNITPATSSADVKAYLTQIDSLRPEEFSDGQLIASAIQSAANGNIAPLAQVRARIGQFATSLKQAATPKPAQEYQQLYVSLIDFTIARLQIIEQNATGADQQKAVQAVLDIQNILPSQVTKLSQLRATVEGIANQ